VQAAGQRGQAYAEADAAERKAAEREAGVQTELEAAAARFEGEAMAAQQVARLHTGEAAATTIQAAQRGRAARRAEPPPERPPEPGPDPEQLLERVPATSRDALRLMAEHGRRIHRLAQPSAAEPALGSAESRAARRAVADLAFGTARAMLLRGDVRGALAHYLQASEAGREPGRAHNGAAICLAKLGRHEVRRHHDPHRP
jgi:hypothetical protein